MNTKINKTLIYRDYFITYYWSRQNCQSKWWWLAPICFPVKLLCNALYLFPYEVFFLYHLLKVNFFVFFFLTFFNNFHVFRFRFCLVCTATRWQISTGTGKQKCGIRRLWRQVLITFLRIWVTENGLRKTWVMGFYNFFLPPPRSDCTTSVSDQN